MKKIKSKLIVTILAQQKTLACDYWFRQTTRCAEPAVVRLERNGETLHACEKHRRSLARVCGK